MLNTGPHEKTAVKHRGKRQLVDAGGFTNCLASTQLRISQPSKCPWKSFDTSNNLCFKYLFPRFFLDVIKTTKFSRKNALYEYILATMCKSEFSFVSHSHKIHGLVYLPKSNGWCLWDTNLGKCIHVPWIRPIVSKFWQHHGCITGQYNPLYPPWN